MGKRREEKKIREEEQARQTEITRKEEERRLKDEKRRQDERRREEEKEKEERRQLDFKVFPNFCKKGTVADVRAYLDGNPDLLNCSNGEPLRQAAVANNIALLQFFLRKDEIQVNLKDTNGRTALHKGARKDFQEIVKELLNHPAIDVNPVDNAGMTPVIEATKFGKLKSLKVLLNDGRTDLDGEDDEITLEEMIGNGLNYPLP